MSKEPIKLPALWVLLIVLGIGIIAGLAIGERISKTPKSIPVVKATPPPVTITPFSRPLPPTLEPQEPYLGIWLSKEDLARLPTSGMAWESLKTAADQDPDRPDLSDQNQTNNVYVLAKALVYARTGERQYRDEVIQNLMDAIATESGGRTLALGRNLVAYVIAADLINLPANPDEDRIFRQWLRHLLIVTLEGRTLRSTNEERPNNWGTHAGASRAAVARYLQDKAELEATAAVFRGYLGDRSAYSNFIYGDDLSWQENPDRPVGINPKGATKKGHSVDGALPEEMRRGDSFRWPPKKTGYAWEALQGAVVQAEILHRAGYAAWEWEDRALLRAVQFLYDIEWEPEGDDQWQVWLINHAYGTTFPATTPTRPGKNMGWTDWSHSDVRCPAIDSAQEESVRAAARCRSLISAAGLRNK